MAFTILEDDQIENGSKLNANPIKGNFTILEEEPDISKPHSLLNAAGKGIVQGIQLPFPFNSGPVPAELGEKLLNKFLPTKNEKAEKYVQRSGRILPSAIIGPESLPLKGAQLAGSTILGQAAENEGLGNGPQIIAEGIGFSFPGLFKGAQSFLKNLFTKGFKQSSGEAIARSAKITPSEVNNTVRESARRLGVLEELPISAQVENPKIQMIESRLMQSATGKPVQQKLERLGGKLVEEYKDIGKTLSHRQNILPSFVSQEAVSTLKSMEETAESAYRSLYNQSLKELPQTAKTAPKLGLAIHRIIDSSIQKLDSSLGTTSKDALLNRLQRLKQKYTSNRELADGLIPIRDLIDLKQDLNQAIKYEAKGGVDKILVPLQRVVKEGIQSYGRSSNSKFLNRFNQAEKIFGDNANIFRKNPIMKSLVKGQNPDQIFSRMNTVNGINQLEKVFNRSAEGKETLDALKKYKLEDLLNKRVLDKNGDISWGKASGVLKDAKTRDLVLKLVGPQQYSKLRDLSRVANGVEEGFKKFINTSKTATTTFDMAILVGLPIKAAQQLFSGNIVAATKTAAAALLPGQLAKLIASPEFVEAAIKTAKAGHGSNASLFIENAKKVAALTAKEMLQNPEEK